MRFKASRIEKAYQFAREMLTRKTETLKNLEVAIGSEVVARLSNINMEDGSQYRPRIIESPSRQAILKKIQSEESESEGNNNTSHRHSGTRSIRISQSVGLNMGLDLEMQQ